MRPNLLPFPILLLTAACAAGGPPPAPDPKTPPKLDAVSFTKWQPIYPSASVRQGEQGAVAVAMLCDEDGHITDGQVMVSSGFPRLDASVEQGAKANRWRCTPGLNLATQKPFAAWGAFRYHFRLGRPDTSTPSAPEDGSAPYAHIGAVLDPQSFTPPPYPGQAAAPHEPGQAAIRFLCGVDGKIIRAEPLSSPGTAPALTDALVAAAQGGGWRCLPGTDSTTKAPMEAWGFYRYTFK
ncbi:MAG: TonB family protein [Azospirillaceae bacterium]|nr:TonB family protein [Azospirillaceae bacterium]